MTRDDITWKESVCRPPKIVGYWKIGDLQVSTTKKPTWFHRTMTRVLLGWGWRDEI
jgi:hypothetical protein